MRILFAITALCLLVLLWAGLAIRRHILAAARERQQRREAPPAAAKAYEVELKQELRTAHIQSGFFGGITDPQPARHISRVRPSLRDSAMRASVTAVPIFEPEDQRGPEDHSAREPEATRPPVETTYERHTPSLVPQAAELAESTESGAPELAEYRKPPVSIHEGEFKRIDLRQYKELGDLSDPYQIPRSSARNRS